MVNDWQKATIWEKNWWGNCANTYNEETKQYIYASKMGLDEFKINYYGRIGWDFGEKSILDIGGGAISILLKSKAKRRVVVDPCDYPNWVRERYKECEIEFLNIPAEKYLSTKEREFDIAFCYNVLQHTIDPGKIISNMKKSAKEIRIFEWIDTEINEGHIHNLTEEKLNKWLAGEGKVEKLNQHPCIGKTFYGIFI